MVNGSSAGHRPIRQVTFGVHGAYMSTDTIDDLLIEIRVQFDHYDDARVEAKFLQGRINAVLEDLDRRKDVGDTGLIDEHIRLLVSNADALSAAPSKDDEDQIMAEVDALLSKSSNEGLNDDDIPRLEDLLAKVKRATELREQLGSALIDVLDAARHVKDRAEPNA